LVTSIFDEICFLIFLLPLLTATAVRRRLLFLTAEFLLFFAFSFRTHTHLSRMLTANKDDLGDPHSDYSTSNELRYRSISKPSTSKLATAKSSGVTVDRLSAKHPDVLGPDTDEEVEVRIREDREKENLLASLEGRWTRLKLYRFEDLPPFLQG
jgi:hypothetical protein